MKRRKSNKKSRKEGSDEKTDEDEPTTADSADETAAPVTPVAADVPTENTDVTTDVPSTEEAQETEQGEGNSLQYYMAFFQTAFGTSNFFLSEPKSSKLFNTCKPNFSNQPGDPSGHDHII